jgi:hypothetical protein
MKQSVDIETARRCARFDWVKMLLAALLVLSVFALAATGQSNENYIKQNICIPNTFAGVYIPTNGTTAVVVFDLKDARQMAILSNVSREFKNLIGVKA